MQPKTRHAKEQKDKPSCNETTQVDGAVNIALSGTRSMVIETVATRDKITHAIMSVEAKSAVLESLRTIFLNGCRTLVMIGGPFHQQHTSRPSREQIEDAFRTMSQTELYQYIQQLTEQPYPPTHEK